MKTELDAVNLIIRALGENPVPSLDIQYPTLSIAVPALEEARLEVLREGWWFNTLENVTLLPDVDGVIVLPEGTIMFYPDCPDYVFDGAAIRRADDGTLVHGTPMLGRLILDKPFEDIPLSARYAIAYHAAHSAYVNDNGEDTTSQRLMVARDRYVLSLSGDHTRSRKANSRRSKIVQRWYHSLGGN